MRELYFTVDADYLELVDSIGHEYEEINDSLKIKVDLDYEREQYDIDVDYLLNQNDELCLSNSREDIVIINPH